MAPVIMGNPDRPELGAELTNSFCRTDPEIAQHFARVTFLSDNRADLPKVKTPIADPAVRRRRRSRRTAVGEYVHRQIPDSELVRDAGDRALPEPERARGDDRRHQGVPRSAAVSMPADAISGIALPGRSRRPPRSSTRTRPAATSRRCPDGTIVTRQPDLPRRGRGYRAGGPRRPQAVPGAAHARRPDLSRDALRAAAADAGRVREIAVDVVCADGRRLPVLVNSVLQRGRGRAAAAHPHHGLRRHRPQGVRERAAPRRARRRSGRTGSRRISSR